MPCNTCGAGKISMTNLKFNVGKNINQTYDKKIKNNILLNNNKNNDSKKLKLKYKNIKA